MTKRLTWLLAVAFAAAPLDFGQCTTNPLKQWLLPPCPSLMDLLSKAIDSARDYRKIVAQYNTEAISVRQRYWKAFPNGPGPELDAAEYAFLKQLNEKDIHYLNIGLVQGIGGDVATKLVGGIGILSGTADPSTWGKFPSDLDGGIRPYAFPLFANWVDAIRRREGRTKDNAWASPAIVAEAYLDRTNWKRAYEDVRNWAEFLASGLTISKYITPKDYLVRQMEADVALTAQRSKPVNPPDPLASALDLYNLFVKMFGEKEVLAAAANTLAAPKNSVGGLAPRGDVLIGAYQSQPSPNPYMMFLTQITNATPQNYAIALCLDPNALVAGQATYTLNSQAEWEKAAATYGQLKARFGEPAIIAAAGRIKDLPKNGQGGISGDNMSRSAVYWFTTLLKNPKTPLPESGQFLASSYDARWIGKTVTVRGTVSRVDVDKGKFPPYATIHFKESKNDKFTAYTPNSEILDEMLPKGVTTLADAVVEVYGNVTDWKGGAGVRFQIRNNLKLLDANALANFKESSPEWMKLPPAPSAVAAAPATENQAEVARVEAARAATMRRDSVQRTPATPSQSATPAAGERTAPPSDPLAVASITPARAPAAPTTPPAPPAPKRDPLIDQVLNQLKQGLNEAGVLRSLKRQNKAVTLTDADRTDLKAAGATDAVIAALLDPSTIPLTPQEQRMAAQRAASQQAAQKLAACLQQAMKDYPNDRQANVKAQMACRSSR